MGDFVLRIISLLSWEDVREDVHTMAKAGKQGYSCSGRDISNPKLVTGASCGKFNGVPRPALGEELRDLR